MSDDFDCGEGLPDEIVRAIDALTVCQPALRTTNRAKALAVLRAALRPAASEGEAKCPRCNGTRTKPDRVLDPKYGDEFTCGAAFHFEHPATPPPRGEVERGSLDVERAIRWAAANSPGWPLYPDALRVFIDDALACGRGEINEEDGYSLENRVAEVRRLAAERAAGRGE